MAARAGVVIGGDNPGYRSVLGDTPELIVDPNNRAEFAALIRELAASETERSKLHAVQQNSVKKFDIKVVGAQIEDIYRAALVQ